MSGKDFDNSRPEHEKAYITIRTPDKDLDAISPEKAYIAISELKESA